MTNNKKRYVLPGIIAGIAILAAAIMLKSSPKVEENFDNARLVDVITLKKQVTAPMVKSYGRVTPKHSLQAISEVNGKIVYRHPELETGRLLKKDTLVLKVDPLQYELKVAQAKASLQSTQVQLARITQEQQNVNASLNIEQQKLTLIDQEYKRKQTLKSKNLISNSELDSQKQTLLAQRNLIQELSSMLSLFPADTAVLEAQINVDQAELENAQRELDNTHFILPFDARIAEVNIETTQAVNSGEVLFEAHQLGSVEIKAELSLKDANTLLDSINIQPINNQLPSIEDFNLGAEVQMNIGDKSHRWPAKLTRVADNINLEQATIGFYLEVIQSFEQLQLVNKQLLTKGMFVTAIIDGFESEQFIIPERALHGSQIYIMDSNDQLQIVDVQVLFRNSSGVAVSGQIEENDLLVLNDLIPAIPGMVLRHNQTEQENTEDK